MSDLEVQTPAGAVPQEPGLSQWARVTNTFTAPSKTFDDIKRGHRSWWLPLLIMAIVGYIFFAAVNFKVGMPTVVDNQMKLASEKQQE